jgi:hypothetical protein
MEHRKESCKEKLYENEGKVKLYKAIIGKDIHHVSQLSRSVGVSYLSTRVEY